MTKTLTLVTIGVLGTLLAQAAEVREFRGPRGARETRENDERGPLPSLPYFVTASASGRVSLSGEKQNLPAGERLGGGGTGSTLPNAIDANFTAGYLFSASDQISGLYQHALRFAQEDITTASDSSGSDGGDGGRGSFVPPDNVASINYLHSWTENFGTEIQFAYLDTTGFQDPSLSFGYRDFSQAGRLNAVTWGLGARVGAPVSDRSQQQGKIATVGLNGNAMWRRGRWMTRARVSTSYSFYHPKDDGATDDGGAEAYGGATTEPVYDETDEWDNEGIPDLPDIEVSYFGREVARTMVNLGLTHRFSRSWSLGTSGSVSYAYLESTASKWKTNWNVLAITARVGGFAAGLSATLTSPRETQEQLTFPDQWGAMLTLSYEFPIFGGPRGLSARSGRGFGGL